MTIAAQTEDVEAFLSREMRRIAATGDVTKRTAARLAIAAAINGGLLPKGSLIPTEKRLTRVLGVSLGTVQAALQQLQQSSIIVRRRGDGSRVASTEALDRDTWHFRLLSKDTGQPLRVSDVSIDVEMTDRTGPWSDFFANDDAFVMVRRRMIMSDAVLVGAEMFLPATKVPGLERITPDELKLVNIRPYLAEKYGIQVSRANHEIETTTLHDLEAKRYCLAAGVPVFQIVARTFLSDARPAYWQRIIAPCADCRVTF